MRYFFNIFNHQQKIAHRAYFVKMFVFIHKTSCKCK